MTPASESELLGCTGSCWGDHLHFEIRDGRGSQAPPRDPLPPAAPVRSRVVCRACSSSQGRRSRSGSPRASPAFTRRSKAGAPRSYVAVVGGRHHRRAGALLLAEDGCGRGADRGPRHRRRCDRPHHREAHVAAPADLRRPGSQRGRGHGAALRRGQPGGDRVIERWPPRAWGSTATCGDATTYLRAATTRSANRCEEETQAARALGLPAAAFEEAPGAALPHDAAPCASPTRPSSIRAGSCSASRRAARARRRGLRAHARAVGRDGRPAASGTPGATSRPGTCSWPPTSRSSTAGSTSPACTPSAPTRSPLRLRRRPPEGMFISADEPTRSLRSHPVDGGELLILGGEGHKVGQAATPRGATQPSRPFAREHFDVVGGRLPLVRPGQHAGRRPPLHRPAGPSRERSAWPPVSQMGPRPAAPPPGCCATSSPGARTRWAESFDPQRLEVRGAADLVKENADVGAALLRRPAAHTGRPPRSPPGPGRGQDRVAPRAPAALATATTTATCTPSRPAAPTWAASSPGTPPSAAGTAPATARASTADGEVLQGPAVHDLDPRDPPP